MVTRLALLEVDHIDASVVAHITEQDLDDVENLSCVVTERPLDQSGVHLDPTAHDIACFLVDLLPIKLDRAILFVGDPVDASLIFLKMNIIILHLKAFRQYLVG